MVIDDIETLIDSTAEALGIHRSLITGPSRHSTPSFGRQIVMALWSEDHSLQEAAEVVNRTSHSLAIYARQRIFSKIQGNSSVRQRLESVISLYRQKKARPSQYLNVNFFAEMTGILSPLNPHTETKNTNAGSDAPGATEPK